MFHSSSRFRVRPLIVMHVTLIAILLSVMVMTEPALELVG
jgi:hypothetical protein